MIVKILLQRSLHFICDTVNIGSGSDISSRKFESEMPRSRNLTN